MKFTALAMCALFLTLSIAGLTLAAENQLKDIYNVDEALCEALTPKNLPMQQRIAWAQSMKGETKVIIPGQEAIQATFSPAYTADSYIKNNRYYEKNIKFTGNVDMQLEGFDLPFAPFKKAIAANPKMKLVKLGSEGVKHITDYYRIECAGREPALISFEGWYGKGEKEASSMKDFRLRHDMTPTKKGIRDAVSVE